MFDPVSRSQFLRFIRQPGALQNIFGVGADDEDEDDDDYDPRGYRRRRRRGLEPSPFPKVPSDVGRDLMESGTFGTNDRLEGTYKRKSRLGNRIMQRELGLSSPGKERSRNKLAAQVSLIKTLSLLPLTNSRVSSLLRTPTQLFTTAAGATLANSPTMATSSSRARKTFECECTILQTLSIGPTTRLYNIPTDNGRSQMHLSAPTTASLPTALLEVWYVWQQQIPKPTPSRTC